jgi:bifunctional UDP-N-acetylglucosamine pyrophosphorylase/glucosamine-1-phosphate N-acetyltransferase
MLVIVLAAGKGSRMGYALPKPLLSIDGEPMLKHVLRASQVMESNPLNYRVVYGFGKEEMRAFLKKEDVGSVYQREQLGTGHAVKEALKTFVSKPSMGGENLDVIVLYGDVPLIKGETLVNFVNAHKTSKRELTVMSTELDDPSGYGRIIENAHGELMGIIEEKDSSFEDKKVKKVNTGILVANTESLKRWCNLLTNNNNSQGEYYLTDVVSLAVAEQANVGLFNVADSVEVSGANTPGELDNLESAFIERKSLIKGKKIKKDSL